MKKKPSMPYSRFYKRVVRVEIKGGGAIEYPKDSRFEPAQNQIKIHYRDRLHRDKTTVFEKSEISIVAVMDKHVVASTPEDLEWQMHSDEQHFRYRTRKVLFESGKSA